MKHLLFGLLAVLFMACGDNGETKKATTTAVADPSAVYVYYFHGKQRCKTCIAVGDIAKKTVETSYAGNDKVKFMEIDTSDKQFEHLVTEFQVSWNALIITKGDEATDLTEDAFANALDHPETVSQGIDNVVKQFLQ